MRLNISKLQKYLGLLLVYVCVCVCECVCVCVSVCTGHLSERKFTERGLDWRIWDPLCWTKLVTVHSWVLRQIINQMTRGEKFVIESFNNGHFIGCIITFYFNLCSDITPLHLVKRFNHHCGDRSKRFQRSDHRVLWVMGWLNVQRQRSTVGGLWFDPGGALPFIALSGVGKHGKFEYHLDSSVLD